ncbi:hypothetical protein MACK_002790 [Theileria orientalis]|uniref:Uncharacterized protein n=1 Tax=Theileria orientalis TaxID=68886 RepID=A0A976QXG1_THEOR|nr:hypothetical protein MACK_002790 [Theileria orientalis]
MLVSYKQCLAWLVLSLTLLCIESSNCLDVSDPRGSNNNDPYVEQTGINEGPGPPSDPPPPVGFATDKSASRSVFKSMFNYLFGLDYPYHQFTPPKEEERIEIPQSLYTKKKVDLDVLDFTDIDDDKLNKLLYDVLLDYHPGHFTQYKSEWGHTVLTKDGQIPLTGDAIHFDIFDGYLPMGITFNDLRVLFLYTIQEGFYLYKVKFGDMVVTLRPDLENVTVHLFENYGGLMIIRILFFIEGMFEKHEYIETGRKTRLFKKMSGRSITPPMPKFPADQEVTEEMILQWMKERYRGIAKSNPPIVEELVNYKIVFTR